MFFKLLQMSILIGAPFFSKWLSQRWIHVKWLSPVVICYAIGILLGNVKPFPIDLELAKIGSELCVLMSIPLLLYSTDLIRWFKTANYALKAFAICAVSGFIAAGTTAIFFQHDVSESWKMAGMLAGLYTGGTPNLQAIGAALAAKDETTILLNAADVITGTIYLLFLLSVGHSFFGLFLPKFQAKAAQNEVDHNFYNMPYTFKDSLKGIGLTILIIAIVLGITSLSFKNTDQPIFILLMITTLSLLFSFSPVIRSWRGTFGTGELFLLGFCTAIGMRADLSQVAAEGGVILLFDVCALSSTVFLNVLLAHWFRIDRDTMMITSTAGLYGPAFVGQVATVIGNRELVFSGMAMGLLGYAIGNYWGIGLAYLIKWVIGE